MAVVVLKMDDIEVGVGRVAPVGAGGIRKICRTATERTWCSHDDAELFYRAWMPAGRPKGAVILFHRGHEHSGRWQDVVDGLDMPDHAFFAWDARGHGRSPGERGHAESFGTLVRDADAFVRHVCETHHFAMADVAILAHSVGAVIASTWLHDYAPPVRAVVLGSPALRVRLYVPFAIPLLRLLLKLRPKAVINSYVKGRLLTRDPAKQREYDTDPLITPTISVRVLTGLHDAGTRLIEDAAAIHAPVLMLTSGADWVVDRKAQYRFFERLGGATNESETYAGFRHDTFGEKDRHLPIRRARRFLLDAFADAPVAPALIEADRAGHTRDEYEALARPLPLLSPKRIGYAAMRLGLATVGRLSEGIRLGWREGFDSGAMLDYVYRDEARGYGPLGRAIDRSYLDSPGWRGIRVRRALLGQTIGDAMRRLTSDGQPVRLLDIATGHGRYVFDALQANPGIPAVALLRDYSAENIEAGRRLASKLGLDGIRLETGDAFDRDGLAAVEPRPTLALVSGLYELYPENTPIRASLAGLAAAVEPGGYLVYTNQPWHPQIEFIARVLSSHRDGSPWIMRRRSQAEMDQLVAEAGFEKLVTAADDDGIFTVSLARRV